MFNNIILKIKRKETRFYEYLYNTCKYFINYNIPVIKHIHRPLYYFDYFIKVFTSRTVHLLWSIPLFKSRCTIAGKNLHLPNGIPLIVGSHLKIYLGDNVSIGRSTISANKVFDNPTLKIGNNSTLGYGTVISISKEVTIGDNCLIAPNCIIMDSDDHPINPNKRLTGNGITKDEIKSVSIGNNVWIGSYCSILKGVNIGENSIISAHSVITKDVLPNCIYAGNPARPTLRDIDKI